MSHADVIYYAGGLLVAWVGLIFLTVSLFVVAGRADDCGLRCECIGECREEESCS